MPRVQLLTSKDFVAPEHHALYDELATLRGRLSGPATVVFHSPALSKPWNDQSEFLHREAMVEPRYAELGVAAAARERDCRYIFSAHARAARRGGASEAALNAVRDNAPLDGLAPDEAAVISYTRQLLRNNRVDQPTFDALLNAHGPQWLVELTGFIGRYSALAGILNSFEVLAKDDAEPMPIPMPNAQRLRGSVAPPQATPRVTLISQREQVAEGQRHYFDSVAKTRGRVGGPYSILMYSPKYCTLMAAVSKFLRSASTLKPNACELVAIAVTREKDCPFVWASHVVAARKAGVSEQTIAAVRDRTALTGLDQDEADIADYVRQLHRTNLVTQALFDRLRARHGVTWLVELTALIGHYGMITAQLNAFEMAPKPEAEQLPL